MYSQPQIECFYKYILVTGMFPNTLRQFVALKAYVVLTVETRRIIFLSEKNFQKKTTTHSSNS